MMIKLLNLKIQVVSLAQIVGLDANRRHLEPPGASSIHCNSSVNDNDKVYKRRKNHDI